MWRRSSEESNTSSIEFNISAFNDLFPSRAPRRSAQPPTVAMLTNGDENGYVGKKKCPPWKEVEEGLTSGKYVTRRMNSDHDLYERVEKICEDGQPQFYHCLKCNALLRYNSGGSYRRHFAICKLEDEDEEEPPDDETTNTGNENEPNGDEPSTWANGTIAKMEIVESNGHQLPQQPARVTRSRAAEKRSDREAAASEMAERRKFFESMIEWSIVDLIPLSVFESTAFRRMMNEHALLVDSRARGLKDASSFGDLVGSIGTHELDRFCVEQNEKSRHAAVDEINRNGIALIVEFCSIDDLDYVLLTAYFFRKSQERWTLDSTIVDFAEWKSGDERNSETLRKYAADAMKRLGVREAVVADALVTVPTSDLKPFGSANSVFCTSQLFHSIARRVCAFGCPPVGEKLGRKLSVEQIDRWHRTPAFLAQLDSVIDAAPAASELAQLLRLKPQGSATCATTDSAQWLRQFDALDCVLDKWEQIRQLVEKKTSTSGTFACLTNLIANRPLLADLHSILALIAKPARAQQVNDTPTLGRTIPILSRLVIDLRRLVVVNSDRDSGVFAAIALDELERQLPNVRVEVEGVAAFLDPNTRRVLKVAQQQMGEGAWDYNEIKDAVRKAAHQLDANDNHVLDSNGVQHDEEPTAKRLKMENSSTNADESDLFYGFDVRDCQPQVEEEFGDYEAVPVRGHVDVGRFWAERADSFPKLSALASRFLCAQASITKSARTFDLAAAVHLQRRSRLTARQLTSLLEARRSLAAPTIKVES